MNSIIEKPRTVGIRAQCDVLVVGGGTAGVVAALAAARNGASTILVERYGFLGGTMINGATVLHSFFNLYKAFPDAGKKQLVKGIPQEIVDRMIEAGGCPGHVEQQKGFDYDSVATCFDHEIFKHVIFNMMQAEGVKLLLHTLMADTISDGADIKGIIVESKSGREAILAKVVIDTTGDADVVYKASPDCVKKFRDDIAMTFGMANVNLADTVSYLEKNGMLLQIVNGNKGNDRDRVVRISFDLYKNPLFADFLKSHGMWGPWTSSLNENDLTYINCTNVLKADGTDVEEITEVEVTLRKQVSQMVQFLKKNIPGFERGYLSWTSVQMGVRLTRIVDCEYDVTNSDIENAVRFEDEVFLYGFHDCAPERIVKGGGAYGFPYRALLPRKLQNLLVAGRLVTSNWHAHMSTRNTVACMAQGQAAGTAAALSIGQGVTPRELNTKELRKALLKDGVFLGE